MSRLRNRLRPAADAPSPVITASTRLPGLLSLAVGEHLASTPFFLVNLVWGIILSLTLSNDIRQENLSSHLLAVLAAQGIFSVLIAGTYRANVKFGQPISPRSFIMVFLAAGAVRGAVLQFLLGELNLSVTDNYPYRIFAGITSMGLSAWFWAVLLGVLAEWRRQTAQLNNERNYLEKLQTEVDTAVTSATDLEIDAFRTYLLTNLQLKGKANPETVRNELTRVVNEVIRPVVDAMLLRRTAVTLPEESNKDERINLRNILQFVSAKRAFQPLIQVVPGAPAAIAGALVLYGYKTALWAFAAFAILWPLLLWLVKYAIAPLLDKLPPLPRFHMLVITFLLTASPVAIALATIPHYEAAQWVGLEFMIYALVTGVVLSLWFAYLRELARVYRIRDQFIHHIHWKVAEVNSRRWHQQLHFARRVHGSLQSEVAAMAIRLDREMAKSKGVVATKIGEIQETLQQRVQQVFEAPEAGLNPHDVLAEIAETWEGICQISVQLDPTDAQQLMRDPIAVETALEVVREAVSNAIRHGSASRIDLSLTIPDETLLRVEVSNDGVPPADAPSAATPHPAREGTGSKHLQECSVTYTLTQRDGRTQLLADLPFRG